MGQGRGLSLLQHLECVLYCPRRKETVDLIFLAQVAANRKETLALFDTLF